jgi:predicted RNA polymerase sigma factor
VIDDYVRDMTAVFANARAQTRSGGLFVIVIDDSRGLYDRILEDAGLTLVERRKRHVNRRTGRRQGEFFEEIILATT